MQLAPGRKLPFDDPQVLTSVRIGYVASQVLVLGVDYYVSLAKKNDQTVLKYLEPALPKLITTTIRDYDLSETSKPLRSAYMVLAMLAVIHLYFHFTQPLFIQALMGMKTLYDAKRGHPPSMFGVSSGPHTDAAEISEAAKRIGGKKEE